MSMIREVISIALPNFELSESSKNIVKYAKISGKESTLQLRKAVKEKFFKKELYDLPYWTSADFTSPEELATKYNELLKDSRSKSIMESIFDFNDNVGRGEVLLAYLHEDISVGGTGQSYDIDFNQEEIEVKEVKLRDSGKYGGNFRFGVESSEILKLAHKRLTKLYSVARHYIPSIDNDKFSDNVYKKGGMALAEIRKWKMPKDIEVKEIEVRIDNKGFVYLGKEAIGNISDSKIEKSIKELFISPKDIMSFPEIERDLEKSIQSHSRKYFLFATKDQGMRLHYKKSLSKIKIESMTAWSVKVAVKL